MKTSSKAAQGDRFRTAVVIGAAGWVGRSLLNLLQADGHQVTGFDLREEAGLIRGDVTRPSSEFESCLRLADLVVLTIPADIVAEHQAWLTERLTPGALLVECSSVKAPFAARLPVDADWEAVSINPLFGPGLVWRGRTVVLTTLRGGPAADRWIAFLRRTQVHVLPMDVEQHDQASAIAQAAFHASLLAQLQCGLADAWAFNPPPAAVGRRLAARIATGSPHVYWEIQAANPWASLARRSLIESLTAIEDIVDRGDFPAFEALIHRARARFGSEAGRLAEESLRLFEALDDSAVRDKAKPYE